MLQSVCVFRVLPDCAVDTYNVQLCNAQRKLKGYSQLQNCTLWIIVRQL